MTMYPRLPETATVGEMEISYRAARILEENSIHYAAALAALGGEHVAALKGIGKRTLLDIAEGLEFHGFIEHTEDWLP